MSSFKNKQILITGGAGGMGMIMGKRILKEDPSRLIIWDLDHNKLNNAENELSQYQEKILTCQVDVSVPDQIYQAAKAVLDQISHLDILINNAGIVVGKRFAEHSQDEVEQSINVNLLGMMHTTRAFLPGMIDRKSGHIVNIASAAGLMPNPQMTVYAGSKWGAIGWSESLRVELAQQQAGVNVTTVEPSYINTDMFKGVTPPLLTPILKAEEISDRIIKAIQQNKIHLRAPFMVKLLPFLKGILPTKVFDFLAGQCFQAYHAMDTFQGHRSKKD